jgi:hypothetical protein
MAVDEGSHPRRREKLLPQPQFTDMNRAKLPHKSSAARTSDLPRAQVVCQPHRIPGRRTSRRTRAQLV